MKNVSKYIYIFITLSILIPVLSYAERPLEDASYSEGMNAIKEMHALNLLGVTGELIGIYKALSKASYGATILHNRKWRPGYDDLAWADHHKYSNEPDPFAGLSSTDRHIIKKRLKNIQYFNGLIESGELDRTEKNEALLGIKKQANELKRTLASYPYHYARLFQNNETGGTLGKVDSSLSGTWNWNVNCPNGATANGNFTISSVKPNGSFKGKLRHLSLLNPIQGRKSQNKISFKREINPNRIQVWTTNSLSSARMAGSLTDPTYQTCRFTAKKQ